jgi:hypothetical protein
VREDLTILGGVFAVVIILFTGIFLLANAINGHSCAATADKMGLEHSYSATTPCMVKVDGRWEPLSWQRSVRIKD